MDRVVKELAKRAQNLATSECGLCTYSLRERSDENSILVVSISTSNDFSLFTDVSFRDDEIEREENSGMDEEQKREAVTLLCECGSTITATRHIKDVARKV